jgi:hypothetical protein
MPQLTFPITPDGLRVNVLVNLDAAILVPLRSSGQPTPSPLAANGLIDTGSDITVVSTTLLQQLGAAVQPPVTTQGISGAVLGNTYLVCLHILNAQNVAGPWLTQAQLRVMGLPLGTMFDVLIGMDILRTCKLTVDGPAGKFTLDF